MVTEELRIFNPVTRMLTTRDKKASTKTRARRAVHQILPLIALASRRSRVHDGFAELPRVERAPAPVELRDLQQRCELAQLRQHRHPRHSVFPHLDRAAFAPA